MSNAALLVQGKEHKGWTDIEVVRSVEQLAHSFSLAFTERWADDKKPIPIREGYPCELFLDDKSLTVGYVDDASVDYTANDHTVKVSGRSLTGDLVDCSAIHKSGHWKNQPLLQIAKDLCAPFQILVTAKADLGANFKWFAIEDGETCYETLERACRMRGVLMMTTPHGHLSFDKVGAVKTQTVIRRGSNVIQGGRSGSWKDRFQTIKVKAQAAGDNESFAGVVAHPTITVTDDAVDRYRVLIVQAESQAVGTELTKRANWERNVRAGRAQKLKYTLDGWTNKEGLWQPNTLVRVVDPWLEVDTELLVVSVKQTKDSSGTNTELELTDPRALTVQPLTKHPKGKISPYITGSRPA